MPVDFARLERDFQSRAELQRSKEAFYTFKTPSKLDFIHLPEPLLSIGSGLPDFL
jgi:hypothetical protein